MKTKKLLALFFILCLLTGIVAAQGSQRESLRGIGGVTVNVLLSSTARRSGLTDSRLKTIAELGLRKNGISIGSSAFELTVNVTAIESQLVSGRSLGYTAFIEVFLDGLVTILVNDSETIAQIWGKGRLFLTDENFVREVGEVVEEFIDEFSNDYLAVNPK